MGRGYDGWGGVSYADLALRIAVVAVAFLLAGLVTGLPLLLAPSLLNPSMGQEAFTALVNTLTLQVAVGVAASTGAGSLILAAHTIPREGPKSLEGSPQPP